MIISLNFNFAPHVSLTELGKCIVRRCSKGDALKDIVVRRLSAEIIGANIEVTANDCIKIGSFIIPEGIDQKETWAKELFVGIVHRWWLSDQFLSDKRLGESFNHLTIAIRQVLPDATPSLKYYSTVIHPVKGTIHKATIAIRNVDDALEYKDITESKCFSVIDNLFCPAIADQLKIYIHQVKVSVQSSMKEGTKVKLKQGLRNDGDGLGFDWNLKICFTDWADTERELPISLDSTVIDFTTGKARPHALSVIHGLEF